MKENDMEPKCETSSTRSNTLVSLPHKIFDVIVDNRSCEVWELPDKHHDFGKWDGCPDTWWLKYISCRGEEEWLPYTDSRYTRIVWDLDIQQNNKLKYKWDEYVNYTITRIVIKCNKKPVYEVQGNELFQTIRKAQNIIDQLSSAMGFQINKADTDIIGRTVFYFGTKCKVTRMGEDGVLRLESIDGSYIAYPKYLPYSLEPDTGANVELLDPNIRWFDFTRDNEAKEKANESAIQEKK